MMLLTKRVFFFIQLLGICLLVSGMPLFIGFGAMEHNIAETNLSEYWRTSYDILVRPPQSLAFLDEEGQRLIEPNFLSGQSGGITLEQYETIKSIAGIEIAAPIAVVGHFPVDFLFQLPIIENEPGIPWNVYKDVRTFHISDGTRVFTTSDVTYYIQNFRDEVQFVPNKGHVYLTPEGKKYPLTNIPLPQPGHGDRVVVEGKRYTLYPDGTPVPLSHGKTFSISLLVAGIDPLQEHRLIGLENSIINGRYFLGEDRPWKKEGRESALDKWVIPVIYNEISFKEITIVNQTYKLEIPPEDELPALLAKKGLDYLDGLNQTLVQQETKSLDEFLQEDILANLGGKVGYNMGGMMWTYTAPSPVTYIPGEGGPGFSTVLEAVPLGINTKSPNNEPLQPEEVRFREGNTNRIKLYSDEGPYGLHFDFMPVGVFEFNVIQDVVNQVPMETYAPPLATLRFSPDGEVVPPTTIHPTDNPTSYLSDPPALLTNLEGAHFLAQRDDFISAIRVRVSDVGEIGEASQARIERVAAQIREQTGLQVDITLGSSPQEVLVKIPGYQSAPALGYISEYWVKQFVGISLQREFNAADALLFGAYLLICSLYAYSSSSLSSLRKRRELAIYKAVGWETKHLFAVQMRDNIIHAAIAGGLAAGLSLLIMVILHNQQIISRLVFAILAFICSYLVGAAIPAWQASQLHPDKVIRTAGIINLKLFMAKGKSSLSSISLLNLFRKPERFAISCFGLVFTTSLLSLFVSASLVTSETLKESLLGQKIIFDIKPYHFGILAILFALNASAVFQTNLQNIFERFKEIGLLKAVGWDDFCVMDMFVREGVVLGMISGVVSILTSIILMKLLFTETSLSTAIGIFAASCTSVLLGLLSVVFPAKVISQHLPASAIRG